MPVKHTATATYAVLLLSAVLLSGCVKEKISRPYKERVAETIARLNVPYEQAWNATMLVLTVENGLGINVRDRNAGLIVTRWQNESFEEIPRRFQINVKISSSETLTYITIYKREEIFRESRWISIPSNHKLEKMILETIAKRLKTKKEIRPPDPPPPSSHKKTDKP